MKLGVVNEDIWDFFHEVYQQMVETHQTSLFKRRHFDLPIFNSRVNRSVLQRDFQKFIENNDVVFFEWGSELLALATRLPKRCGIVVRLHRYDVYAWFNKVDWDAVDKIILVSQAKRREFATKYPSQADKIVVIPEAIDLNKFQTHPKAYQGNLGILCHLSPRKRVYDLVLSFYELAQKIDGLHLYIGGDPRPAFMDYYEALQSLIRRLNLQDQVTFDGLVTDSAAWYRKIDIFISNSYSEGLQVSPMEAIASGCFCLSHNWDGAEELLPGENIYFTDSELQDKIIKYHVLSGADKSRISTSLRDIVAQRFDVDKTKIEILRLLEEVGQSDPHRTKISA